MSKTLILAFIFLLFTYCGKNSTGPSEEPADDGWQHQIDWPTLADSPWPMFQHDPQGTGRSEFSGPKKGIISNWSNVICKGGSKFTFTTIGVESNVYLSIGNVWSDSLLETNGYLFKISKNGDPLWTTNLKGNDLYNSPLIDNNGVIYIGSTDNYLYAINPDGTIKWKFNAYSQITSGFGGITIDLEGTLYFSTVENMYAVNRDGTLIWSLPGQGNTRILISPDNNTLYVINKFSGLNALDKDGNLKWNYYFGSTISAINPLVDYIGRIYVPTNDSTYTVINEQGGMIWKFCIGSHKNKNEDRIDFNVSPTIDNMGNFYFTTVEDLYSLSYFGGLNWIIRGLGGSGSHLISDREGNVYLISERFNTRDVFSITRSGFLNWKLSLPSEEYLFCAPSISSDKKMYVVTLSASESKLYIIE